LDEIELEVLEQVKKAVREAAAAPFPKPEDLFTDVYVDPPPHRVRGTEQFFNGFSYRS